MLSLLAGSLRWFFDVSAGVKRAGFCEAMGKI